MLMVRLLVLLSFVILLGCSQKKVNVTTLNPPNYPQVAKYKTVAFLPFKGKDGDKLSLELESKVKNIKVNGKPYFKVIDRQTIKEVLSEQKLQLSGLVDEKSIVEIGKITGVKGIFTGAVLKADTSTQPFYEKRFQCLDDKCKKTREYFVRCFKKTAVFSFVARLVDTKTAEVVYSNTHTGKDYASFCIDSGYRVSSFELLENAKQQAINSFIKDIAPYKTSYFIKIKEDAEGLSGFDEPLFESSLEWVEAGDLNKACKIWERLIKKYPENTALLYNLGVCYEVKGKYEKSYNYFKKAYDLLTEPDEDVIKALSRVKFLIDKNKKLKKVISE